VTSCRLSQMCQRLERGCCPNSGWRHFISPKTFSFILTTVRTSTRMCEGWGWRRAWVLWVSHLWSATKNCLSVQRSPFKSEFVWFVKHAAYGVILLENRFHPDRLITNKIFKYFFYAENLYLLIVTYCPGKVSRNSGLNLSCTDRRLFWNRLLYSADSFFEISDNFVESKNDQRVKKMPEYQ
jgi:hypothetical protein